MSKSSKYSLHITVALKGYFSIFVFNFVKLFKNSSSFISKFSVLNLIPKPLQYSGIPPLSIYNTGRPHWEASMWWLPDGSLSEPVIYPSWFDSSLASLNEKPFDV